MCAFQAKIMRCPQIVKDTSVKATGHESATEETSACTTLVDEVNAECATCKGEVYRAAIEAKLKAECDAVTHDHAFCTKCEKCVRDLPITALDSMHKMTSAQICEGLMKITAKEREERAKHERVLSQVASLSVKTEGSKCGE